ncbi:MAG: TetR/AcrR family transcriptional regulator [Microthrixaceae bacterium]
MALDRTPGDTRTRILDEAERLFARSTISRVATREIVEAAQQRNTSAVTYHFGSRDGLLGAILVRHGGPIDRRRGEELEGSGEASLRDLVAALAVPYAEALRTAGGRSYLRIVDQLRDRFARWDVESDLATSTNLRRILSSLELAGDREPAAQRERVVAVIMVLSSLCAERARILDTGSAPRWDTTGSSVNSSTCAPGL